MLSVMTVLNCIFVSPGFDLESTFMTPGPDEKAASREKSLRKRAGREAAAARAAVPATDDSTSSSGADDSDF